MSRCNIVASCAAVACALSGTHANAQDVAARIAAARDRLAAIESRATGVSDINEIENLQRAYGYYVDKMLWDHVVDLFAEDGTLELGMSGVYVGKQSIRDYLYSMSGGKQGPLEGVLYNFLQLQPIITVAENGQSARGRWRAWVLTGVSGSGSGGNWGEGPYENTYVKEDGVWKLRSIQWYGNYIAPYEEGWLSADPADLRALTVSPSVPPDLPPSVEYEPFPGVFVPPFHYGNPGRGE
jgi:hypothetical protein